MTAPGRTCVSRVGWGPRAAARTLPPVRLRVTVGRVNELDSGAGAPGRGLGHDPPDQARLRQLAEEQAALRRVATLVARGTVPEQVFAAVIEEVGRLLPVDVVSMSHYRKKGTLTFVARWGKLADRFPLGNRRPLGGRNVGTLVFETGRPARVDGYADSSSGPIGAASREAGIPSSVGSPIIVDGRLVPGERVNGSHLVASRSLIAEIPGESGPVGGCPGAGGL
jgi:hypothetical protein